MDASYAAHDDMRGHTGGTISMVKDWCGSIISILKKQKLNTKSLMEAELIRLEKVLPGAQGYGIDENILYQDNMSAMLLEKNGKKSNKKNETYQRTLLFHK